MPVQRNAVPPLLATSVRVKGPHGPGPGSTTRTPAVAAPVSVGRALAGPGQVLQLQRRVGNRAVNGIVESYWSPAGTLTPPSWSCRLQRDTSGDQYNVQAKMAELTDLFKQRLQSGTGERIDDGASSYQKEVVTNGLCGGWVKLFLKYPNWVEPVYNAVRTWAPPERLDGPAKLLNFESHLKAQTRFSGVEHVVALLRDAYTLMGELEPDAGYDSVPEWAESVTPGQKLPQGPTAKAAREEAHEIEIDRRTKAGRDPAKAVCDLVRTLTAPDKPGECMAHIETDLHHMALRVVKSKKGKKGPCALIITVVETEKTGIVRVRTWGEVEAILGAWLREEEKTKQEKGEASLEEITVRTSTVGFS